MHIAGHIPVWFYKDEEGEYQVRAKKKLLERSEGALKRKGRLIVFPEGQLSRDGSLGPFKFGFFKIAKKTGSPIIPVAMWGNHTIFPPGDVVAAARPGRVEIIFGDPVNPEDFETLKDMRDHVHKVISDLQKTLPSYPSQMEQRQIASTA